jgi:hypothetical protein
LHVVVQQATITSARVTGDLNDLDSVSAVVSGQTLRISSAAFAWGRQSKAHGPVTVYITTPQLRSATLSGSGALDIKTIRAARLDLGLVGSGSLSADSLTVEALLAQLSGPGRMMLRGKVAQATLQAQGSGEIDADGLVAQDIKVTSQGATSIRADARRAANITAAGSGSVDVTGKPACSVRNTGSASVTCGQ